MSAINSLPGTILNVAESRALRVEKSADCAGSHGEYRGARAHSDRRTARPDRRAVSRAGTPETAPLWYGPRLRAPFVAQIIGQVLGEANVSNRPSYRADEAQVALVIDRNA